MCHDWIRRDWRDASRHVLPNTAARFCVRIFRDSNAGGILAGATVFAGLATLPMFMASVVLGARS